MGTMTLNRVMIIGKAGKEPEIRQTKNGFTTCNLTIATDESYTDRDGVRQQVTEWHRVSCLGKLAEICEQYVHKGNTVYVEGAINTRKWTDKNGVDRETKEIKAQRIINIYDASRNNYDAAPMQAEQQPRVERQEEQEELPF